MQESSSPAFSRLLSMRQIEVFYAVMSTGSASAAGRMLHVSQPAISRTLSATESRLGYALFERLGGRLRPTFEAKQLYAEVRQVYLGILRVNDVAKVLSIDRSSMLRVMSTPALCESVIPDAMKTFRAKYPHTRIKYLTLTLDYLLPEVLLGHTDIAITMTVPPEHTDLLVTEIGRHQVLCLIPRQNPLAARDSIRIEDLRAQRLIGYGSDTPFGSLLRPFLESDAGHPIENDIEVRSTVTAVNLVCHGLGVALVDPYSVTTDILRKTVARPLNPPLPLRVHAFQSRTETRSNLGKPFLSIVKRVFQDYAPGL